VAAGGESRAGRSRRGDGGGAVSSSTASSCNGSCSSDDGDSSHTSSSSSSSSSGEPNLPYPGFPEISMKALTQYTRPRNWCLMLITNPYPLHKQKQSVGEGGCPNCHCPSLAIYPWVWVCVPECPCHTFRRMCVVSLLIILSFFFPLSSRFSLHFFFVSLLFFNGPKDTRFGRG